MYYDYHMHSEFSHDSTASIESMIKRSIELSLREICFTDHVDYGILIDGQEIDFDIDYNDYFSKLNYYSEIYKNKIVIKKGIEMGLQEHVLEKCKKDILNNEFDFVIASIHCIDKYELIKKKFYEDKTEEEAFRIYFENLYKLIKEYNDYSILGHLDIVKRYGNLENTIDDRKFTDIIDEILKKVIYEGKGIEINTSCYRYNLPDYTPSLYIIKRYKELGGEILTIGSDSHKPDQIAYKFKVIYDLLQHVGYKYVCTFNKMKPSFVKL